MYLKITAKMDVLICKLFLCRYSQPLWMQTGMPGMMQTMHAIAGNPSEDYMRTNGPWGGPHTQFQGPWMGTSNQNIFHGSFIQNQLDVYLQRPNFTGNIGHYGHMNDALQYSFQVCERSIFLYRTSCVESSKANRRHFLYCSV